MQSDVGVDESMAAFKVRDKQWREVDVTQDKVIDHVICHQFKAVSYLIYLPINKYK